MNEIGVEWNLEGMEESGDYDGLDKEKNNNKQDMQTRK